MAPGPPRLPGPRIEAEPALRADVRSSAAARLEGVAGFRDLGGFPTADGRVTRHRVLFRSPSPSELTESDRDVLAGLGLTVRIDLRAAFEVADAPPVALPGLPSAHVPILDAPDSGRYVRRLRQLLGDRRDPAAVLRAFLVEDGAAFARVFSLLATRTPALVHCTTGRDRTGMVTALALRLVGVDDGLIAVDYAESRARGLDGDGDPLLEALELLDRRWGGAAQYLIEHGCAPAALTAFRKAFAA